MEPKIYGKHKPRVKFNCAFCDKEQERAACFTEGKKRLFCDKTCFLNYQRSPMYKQVPPNSFFLLPESADIMDRVHAAFKEGLNGPQIMQRAKVTRSVMSICLKKLGLKVPRNLVRLAGKDSPKWVDFVQVPCFTCGKIKNIKPYDLKGKERVYCNNKCQNQRLKLLVGELSARYITPRTLECNHCGKQYSEPKNIKAGETSRFCTRPCYLDWAKKQVGPKHPRYVGQGKGRGDTWAEQKRLATERDEGICQLCEVDFQGNALDVHHIRPYKFFNGDFVAANQLTNLVCLCKPCHADVEGRTNEADINNWKEHYLRNKPFPRGITGQQVREIKQRVQTMYREGQTKAAIGKALKKTRAVINACIDGPRPRRLKK